MLVSESCVNNTGHFKVILYSKILMSAQSIVMCVVLEYVLTIQMGIHVNVKMEQCLEPTQTTFLHALVCLSDCSKILVGFFLTISLKCISHCVHFVCTYSIIHIPAQLVH